MITQLKIGGITYQAIKFNGTNEEEIKVFVNEALLPPHLCMGFIYLYIMTDSGIRQCNINDWVIKDKDGNIDILSDSDFSPSFILNNSNCSEDKGVKRFKITNLENIETIAKEFIDYISASPIDSNIFAFYGKMGAGKTTFIKAICKTLNVSENVNSPTFTIVNEYISGKGFPIYHFDFYRINKIEEAYDIGFQEYLSKEGLCFIEWPEKIEQLLPQNIVRIDILEGEDNSRELIISQQ